LLNIFGLPTNEAIAELERPLIDRVSGSHLPATSSGIDSSNCFRVSVQGLSTGLSCLRFAAFFRPQDVPAKTVDACYVGRLTRRKGLFTILEALAWLKHHRGRQISLAIAGDGPEAGPLRESAEALGVAPQVHWHGAVGTDAVVDVLTRSRVFLYPTLTAETLAVAISRRWRAARRLSARTSWDVDYIYPDDNAVVCDPGSPRAWRAVERLLDDADLAARMPDREG